MNRKSRFHSRAQAGFTLAELLVAATLLSMVMTAVYTAFSGFTHTWRLSEENLHAYHDGRIAMTIMNRELNSIVSGSGHLFEGQGNEVAFYAFVRPMDVEQGEEPRIMWVRYRLQSNPREPGNRLVREEAVVEGQLPLREAYDDSLRGPRIQRGRTRTFDLATKVRDFRIRYCWHAPVEEGERRSSGALFEVGEHQEGWGLPQGLRLRLSLDDPTSDDGTVTFGSTLAFRGPTTQLVEGQSGGPRGGGL